MTATISATGTIEIPMEFRTEDRLHEGERFEIERLGAKEYRLRSMLPTQDSSRDIVDWLLACPAKGWFVEEGRGEKTPLKPAINFDE